MRRRSRIKSFFQKIFQVGGISHGPNYLIIFVTALLLLLGMLILLSASSVISYQKFKSPYYMFWHQFIFGFLPGIIAFYVCSKIDFKVWQKLAFLMLLISLGLLIVVFIPGVGANYGKAQSWINIAGISIQPSEIVKLTFLIYLASWLNSKGIRKIKDVHYGLMPFIILMAVITILMLLQPDLGTLSIIVIIALTSFFVGGGNIKHILAIISGAMLLFFIAIKMAPYRAARFIVFMNPNADPQGLGYHLNQALIAVGSGGIFGVGLGHSRQKYGYLPEVAGDSIFAVMAEELGFVFCLVYILLIFVLIYQGILIAKRSKSYYGRILAAGIVSWIGFQSFLNIGSMIGLLPMTGVPLPFLSYGGTAMIMNLAAIGILVNISRYTRT